MKAKTEQMKQAASLTEKLVMSIGQNIREHVSITKEEMDMINRDGLYDDIFDCVVEGYRMADHVAEHRKNKD